MTAKALPDFLIEAGLVQAVSTRLAGRLARRLSAIVGGHHGFFSSQREIDELDDLLSGTKEGSQWKQFSHSIFEQLQTFVGLTSEDLPSQCDNAAAMLLAGLTTVSDWIASNPDEKTGFPYANDSSFEDYAVGLPKKAKRALTADANPINQALSIANSCLYAVCQAALISVGYSPALGYIHTGKPLSFVYDIADLYKAETATPAAFEAVAGTYFDLESIVRRKCREKFSHFRLMHHIVQDVDRILQFGDPDAEAEPVCFLWDDQLNWVEGGKNWSEEG